MVTPLVLLAGTLTSLAGNQLLGISWDIDGLAPGGVFEFARNGSAAELAPFKDNLRTLDSVSDDAGTLHLVVSGCTLAPFLPRSGGGGGGGGGRFGTPVRVDASRCDAGCCFEEWHYSGGGSAVALALGWRAPNGTITNAVVSIDLRTGAATEVVAFDAACAVVSDASAYSRTSSTLWAWLACDSSSRNASIIAFDVAARAVRHEAWLEREFAIAPLLPTPDGKALLGLESGVGWVLIEQGGGGGAAPRNVTAPLPGIAEDHTALLTHTAAAAAAAAPLPPPSAVVAPPAAAAGHPAQQRTTLVSVVVYNSDFTPTPRRLLTHDIATGQQVSSADIHFGVRELHLIPAAERV